MKIGIIHLTDIHFTDQTQLGQKPEKLATVARNNFFDVSKIYFLISGDIAFSGSRVEYSKAKTFINTITLILRATYKSVEIGHVLIPGNHDCNFAENTDLRTNILKNMNYEGIGNDDSVIKQSISVQTDFWGFYGFYRSLPTDKLFYQIVDKVGEYTICFNCINTAWMSRRNEETGKLFFPVKRYEKFLKGNTYDLNVATWHHPLNWFNPNTPENNKNEFQKFIETIAPIHFVGHEHESHHYLNINKNDDISSHVISGKLFNDDKKPLESGFKTVTIHIPTKETVIKSYQWNIDYYKEIKQNDLILEREVSRAFTLKSDFKADLNDLRIPLVFANKKNIELRDLYVFPDMEISNSKTNDKLENYIDSVRLMQEGYAKCVVDGESQIGKSTLLCAIYLQMYRSGHYPILLRGEDVKSGDLDKIVSKAFTKQYKDAFGEYDKFMQGDVDKRILLIDDYQDSPLTATNTKRLMDEASVKFSKVILTLDSANSILPAIQTEFKDWKLINLKQLGFKKRNDLIEKYHYLKDPPSSPDDQIFLDEIKMSYDNVQSVLGNKLMPSYPIFIISILQALEYKPMQQQETSFGYCYQTLIHYSLNKVGVLNENIDSYFNFLTELAYFTINQEHDSMSRKEYDHFFNSYQDQFIVQPYEVVIKILKNSKIIQEKDNLISFGYKYILYYLSAKKVSDVLHKNEGKAIIKRLFENVHEEKNASILVFITHHSKDITFIEESLINSMMVLDKTSPITLEKDDPFYEAIKGLANDVKNDVLYIHKNPRVEREKQLNKSDESERELIKMESEIKSQSKSNAEIVEEAKSIILPFQQSFRSIEIVGQIIRNRKGSLPKNQLKDIIREIYTTGFRTVGFMSEIINSDKDDIIEGLLEELKESEKSKSEIERRVNEIIQLLCLQTCLTVFSKLMHSVGNKDLKELYEKVAAEMKTPAAKLMSFSINSYYGTFTISELKTIEKDLKGNVVALNILKARVKSYVYNRNIDFRTKQQIAEVLQMTLGPNKIFKPEVRQIQR